MKKLLSTILALSMLYTTYVYAKEAGITEATPEDEAMLLESTSDETTPSYTDGEILTEIAYAFDRQGAQVLYDQSYSRRNIYSTPEDATAQRTIFLDCSSFVNSCYRLGFGVNILPYEISTTAGTSPNTVNYDSYAKNNSDAVDVVGYWVTADYTTDEAKQEVVDWIYDNLEVGDLLNYRKGDKEATAGHIYMYIGNQKFIHCAGAGSYIVNTSDPSLSYDANAGEVTSEGTIGTINASDIFENTTHSRYIFNTTGTSKVFTFSILRPLARGLTPTEDALKRMAVAGLSMEKTASVCENASVDTGDTITYTVTLKNTSSSAISGVTVTDTVPEGTELVSADDGVTISGNSISLQCDVAANKTVTVSYSVKVTASIPGSLLVSNNTYVSGLKLGSITHSVSGYSKNQRALLGSKALEYALSGKEFDDGLALANAVYYDTFGTNIIDYSTVGEALDQLIDTENLTRYTTTELSKLIVPNLYGGLDIRYGWLYLPDENEKTRLPKKEHLSVGDVILADWSEGEDIYVYAGENTLVAVENGTAKALTIGDDIYTPGDNILISLLGYDRYAVLRPSMKETSTLGVSSIAVTKAPSKTEYLSGESFEADGMKVEATLTDGSEVEVFNYTVSPSVLVYGMDKVTLSFGEFTADVDIEVSSNELITSVSQARALSENSTAKVEGYVVGVASEGQNNDTEVLIKDISTDDIMAVRNIPYGRYPDFGYKIGDRILFDATVKKDTSPKSSYKNKLYLDFSSDNGTINSTIISSGNKVTYNLNNVTAINSWSDMQSVFDESKLQPYTYLKFSAGSYLYLYPGDYDTYYRIHKNPDAEEAADMKPDGTRAVTFLDKAMTANFGSNWSSLLSDEILTEYPGTFTDKEIYALYIGGNGSYYQILILDESWIVAPEQNVTVTLTLNREADSTPYYSEAYDNRAKMYIYSEEGAELIETIVLESGNNSGKTVTADISLPKGTYYAEIVKNGYKKHCLDLEITADTALDTIELIPGDITGSFDEACGDGVIDIDDFIRVLRGFNSNADAEISSRVDINEDRNVNVSDLAIIKANFGK